jgi:tetratricopeptide (TPR) repeat protein
MEVLRPSLDDREDQSMKKLLLGVFSLALVFGGAVIGHAQTSVLSTDGMGSYKDPVQRAADHYNRGVRAKRKAENETNPAKRVKLYEKAKEELEKAMGYDNFDASLALGQVYLALGRKPEAELACSRALSFKPNNESAKTCMTEALAQDQQVQDQAGSGS